MFGKYNGTDLSHAHGSRASAAMPRIRKLAAGVLRIEGRVSGLHTGLTFSLSDEIPVFSGNEISVNFGGFWTKFVEF